jgi:L-fuconolactonase
MQRREFVRLGASIAGGWAATQVAPALPAKTPVIDTHIHLFDPGRLGGIPWPEKTDTAL